MNSLCLFGRLTKNPMQRDTENGITACYFNLAVPRGYRKSKDGEEKVLQTDFVPCVAYRGLAKVFMDNLQKGDRITVSGRLQSYNVKTAEGPKTRLICVVDKFDFAGDRKSIPSTASEEQELTRMDVPESGIPTDTNLDIADEELPF